MKAAYADPPYVGCARKRYGDPTYDNPENHRILMEQMEDEYEAWALSLHEPSLRTLLPLAPDGVRVGVWVKPFAVFRRGVDPAYAWEPIIYKTARTWSKDQPTVRDWVSCNITMQRGTIGAKPEAFCAWLFQLLGLRPGDEFTDIFPGSGAVQQSWETYRDSPTIPLTATERREALVLRIT